MSKFIYNTTESEITYLGKAFPPEEYRAIPATMEAAFANSSEVLIDIANEVIILSKTGDSSGHLEDVNLAVNFLKGNSPSDIILTDGMGNSLSQLDNDGALITRNKAAQKGWTFSSLPLEFETARLNDTLYSKDASGNSREFITMKAYNSSDVEITTPGLLNANYATITKTVIDFEPPYDFEIIGGDLRTLTLINVDMRLWIIAVPDIPEHLGGSKEMGGGINLKYLSPGNYWSVDGRVAKFAQYSSEFHTNKIRLIFKYPAGTNETLLVVIQLYKA